MVRPQLPSGAIQRYFKVRWFGYPPEEDTWQELASLDHGLREYAWEDEALGRHVRRELRGQLREVAKKQVEAGPESN